MIFCMKKKISKWEVI